MNDPIKIKLKAIADHIYIKANCDYKESMIGLYGDSYGIFLFLCYYSRFTKEQKFAELRDRFCKSLMENIPKQNFPYSFSCGYSGILYLFNFLEEHKLLDIGLNIDIHSIEQNIIINMQNNLDHYCYEFLHGAVGEGIYFLKRAGNEDVLNDIVNRLYKTIKIDKNKKKGKWPSYLINLSKWGYNISLSHGMSSIVLFLTKLIEYNLHNTKIEHLLELSVNYLLSQEIDYMQYGSYFPTYSKESEGEEINGSRLAWCYGDLGIAYAIYRAGKCLQRDSWVNKSSKILYDSTERLSLDKNRVVDPCICHGSSGLALVYTRLYTEFKDIHFLNTANYWINQTLRFSEFSDEDPEKEFNQMKWECDFTFLTGYSGIGLTLLSYYTKSQDWDELLLLS